MDASVRIAQQMEGNAVFVAEFAVAVAVVEADPDDHGAVLGDFLVGVTKPLGLQGAARCVVLRIEVQHDGLAVETAETDILAACVAKDKIRGGITWPEHGSPSGSGA